jgi:hypothetical protein
MEINSGHERPFARLGQAELAVLTINSSHFLTAIIASSFSHCVRNSSSAVGRTISVKSATIEPMKHKVHLPFGFFMNWYGAQKGKGFEYHLLVTAIALAIASRCGRRPY